MFQPQSYSMALALMVVTMLCWGSWANTVKACPGYKFQLFYWDYVTGLIAGALLWGLTLGSFGAFGLKFFRDLRQADSHHLLLALAGGVIFNVANLLLVAAIDIAGLAVAFPIGIGLALVVGAVSSYALAPAAIPCCCSAAWHLSPLRLFWTRSRTGCARRSSDPSASVESPSACLPAC